MNTTRHLILILGDQLSLNNPALDGFNPAQDQLLMIEASEESTHVPSHKARILAFLSAMRHFAHTLHDTYGQSSLTYIALENNPHPRLADTLTSQLRHSQPQRLICQHPGDHRLKQDITQAAQTEGIALDWCQDRHFLCSLDDFRRWAGSKRTLRMETFYRWMRQRTGILMRPDGQPEGDTWNLDQQNRAAFSAQGPGLRPAHHAVPPDAITQQVITLIEQHFAHHPGLLNSFAWPVTRPDALLALQDFIDHRLSDFGHYQDAMWQDEPYLYHSLLSFALNTQLLHPQEVIQAALDAYRQKRAPLNSVEGFIRQILGWREFMRGVYWLDMPGLSQANHLNHLQPLPDFFWTGHTPMRCLSQAIGQTLATGYAHHIQRLMVIGLYATLTQIHPQQLSDWFHAIYIDATDWVQRPNVVGMATFANGGRFTSKPYIASGAYIQRMSNYCQHCTYQPQQKTGDKACPITTLYWAFLIRHQHWLAQNPRMKLMLSHLNKLDDSQQARLLAQADQHLAQMSQTPCPTASC